MYGEGSAVAPEQWPSDDAAETEDTEYRSTINKMEVTIGKEIF